MPWSIPFDEPIPLRGGRKLTPPQHAADFIMKLPENVQREPRSQIAVENLIHAAEQGEGWLMLTRVAMMRALNGWAEASAKGDDGLGPCSEQKILHRSDRPIPPRRIRVANSRPGAASKLAPIGCR